MGYGCYEVSIILNHEQEERLQRIVQKYEKINQWKGKNLLQFSICMVNNDLLLEFLEIKAEQIEKSGLA